MSSRLKSLLFRRLEGGQEVLHHPDFIQPVAGCEYDPPPVRMKPDITPNVSRRDLLRIASTDGYLPYLPLCFFWSGQSPAEKECFPILGPHRIGPFLDLAREKITCFSARRWQDLYRSLMNVPGSRPCRSAERASAPFRDGG